MSIVVVINIIFSAGDIVNSMIEKVTALISKFKDLFCFTKNQEVPKEKKEPIKREV